MKNVDVKLLRPLSRFAEEGVVEGGTRHLHMEEMGVVGDGLMLGIDPCPAIVDGPGRIVTGVFRHWIIGVNSSLFSIEIRTRYHESFAAYPPGNKYRHVLR